MGRLAGKKVLITGGTSGIGFLTARRFIEEGARVAVTGTRAGVIESVRAVLGPEAVVMRADAASVPAQRKIAKTLKRQFGELDAVFMNAGLAEFRPIDQIDEASFDRMMAVNLKGPLFLVQALLPIFARPASIILAGAAYSRAGIPETSVFSASKAGLVALARTLSSELGDRGIRVNVISPGPIDTSLYGKLGLGLEKTEALKERLIAKIPMGRFGQPVEVADLAVYCASDESQYLVGSELVVDGGMSAIWAV